MNSLFRKVGLHSGFILILMLFVSACDANLTGPDARGEAPTAPANHGGDAVYKAVLKPLNPNASARAAFGKAKIRVQGSMATVQLEAMGLDRNTLHLQHIHAADQCPTMADDVNRDGYLDLFEGVPKYGPILIPLDGNLSDEASNFASFPTAPQGKINYMESVSVADLLAYQSVQDDGGFLNIAGRHIVIHGVAASTELPETVGTIDGVPAQVTIPVACGELVLQ